MSQTVETSCYGKLMKENFALISWSEKCLQALVPIRGLCLPTPFPDHVPAFGELLSKGYLANEGKNEMT